MNWKDYKSLKIGPYKLKKLVRASDGAVLFNAVDSILPSTAAFSVTDYSTMMPTKMGMAVYKNNAYFTDVSGTVQRDYDSAVWFYGARGSEYLKYKITYDANRTPLRIIHYEQVGSEGLNYLPSEGYAINPSDANQQRKYRFTNPYDETTYENVSVRFGSASMTESTLHLDGLSFKNDNGEVVMTVGDGFIGYQADGFTPDPAYNFNEHRNEAFSITSIDGTKRISFTIG